MDLAFLLISTIFFLTFFASGIYVFKQIHRKKSLVFYGLALIVASLYVYGITRSYFIDSVKQYVFWTKYFMFMNELGTTIWLLGTYFLQKELSKGKYKVLTIAFITFNILLLYFLLFSNVLVSYDVISGQSLGELKGSALPITTLYNIRVVFTVVKCIFISQFVVKLIKDPEVRKDKDRYNSLIALLISFVLIAAGVVWGTIYPFMWSYYEIIIRGSGIFLFAYSVFNFDLLIEQKKAIQKEFSLELVFAIILSFIYFVAAFILLDDSDFSLVSIGDFLAISGVVILTHSSYERIKDTILFLFRYKKVYVPRILVSDISYVLKNLYSPHLLERSRLLNLPQVERISRKENLSRIEALKEQIFMIIDSFKPKGTKRKRTLPRIKYEILYMLAHEEAAESQIMWDLGFDIYTRSVIEKIPSYAEPRYPLRDGSEYQATSIRSYKRLKKDALEMIRWKLEADFTKT